MSVHPPGAEASLQAVDCAHRDMLVAVARAGLEPTAWGTVADLCTREARLRLAMDLHRIARRLQGQIWRAE